MLSEELKAPKTVLVAEILPLDIRIKKLFTVPEYRGCGIASELLETVTSIL